MLQGQESQALVWSPEGLPSTRLNNRKANPASASAPKLWGEKQKAISLSLEGSLQRNILREDHPKFCMVLGRGVGQSSFRLRKRIGKSPAGF
jgi:hypothetical protein